MRGALANSHVAGCPLPPRSFPSKSGIHSEWRLIPPVHRCTAQVLFVEIAEFNTLAAESTPAQALDLLNAIFWEVRGERRAIPGCQPAA